MFHDFGWSKQDGDKREIMSTQLANFYVFVPPNKVQRPYAFQFLILLPGLSFFLDVHRVILLRAFAFAYIASVCIYDTSRTGGGAWCTPVV